MKAYRVELVIVDFDELGPRGIAEEFAMFNFSNDCIYVSGGDVRITKVVDIGEWDDSHPLNRQGVDPHAWMREQE